MKRSELLFGFLRLPMDFLMSLSALLLAYKLRQISDFIPYIQLPLDLTTFPPFPEFKKLAAIGSLVYISILGLIKGYSFKNTTRFLPEIKKVLYASLIWLMSVIFYYFLIRQFPFSRLALIYSWLIAVLLICLGRFFLKIIQRALLYFGIGKRKILIIGYNQIAHQILKSLKVLPTYIVIGVLDNESEIFLKKGIKILGSIEDLEKIVEKYKVEEIIQTKDNLPKRRNLDILNYCRTHHIQYHFIPDLLEIQHTNIQVEAISGYPLISLKPTPLDGWGKIVKRLYDLIFALIALIFLSPLFLLIAILIKIDSKGPILFSRLDDGSKVMRVGQTGKLFHFIKFRTMIPNSNNLRYTKLAEKNMRGSGPLVKIKNDPRVTRFGKFLRKTSLDEIPQLWTVLIGQMSLVGPRPHLPEEVAKYKDYQKFVLAIKPGLTGLAQISGRSDLPFEEEVRLDTFYIENWRILLDIKILIKTLLVVFKKYQE